jgi:hypothetical protein
MRIPEEVKNTFIASLSIGATGVAIGKMVMGMSILSVVWVPAGTTAVSLFVLSALPSLVLFGVMDSFDKNLKISTNIIMITLPTYVLLRIAARSNVPFMNVVVLSAVSLLAAGLITVPLVQAAVEFGTYTVPQWIKG